MAEQLSLNLTNRFARENGQLREMVQDERDARLTLEYTPFLAIAEDEDVVLFETPNRAFVHEKVADIEPDVPFVLTAPVAAVAMPNANADEVERLRIEMVRLHEPMNSF
jgi:hypothetical protein